MYYARKNEEAETEREETLKILVIFSKNRQRLTKKRCRRWKRLKKLKKTFKIVKDTCERQNCLKISEIAQNLSKLAAENKEFVKFFQIFERFTNLF